MRLASRPALRRLAVIHHAIRGGQYPNANTLAKQLETSSRTIKRDIEFLRDSLHAPLAFSRRRQGYYYSNDTWQLPYFELTEGEMVALLIAERALRQYRGTPYEKPLHCAFEKIAASLPNEISLDLSTLLDQTHSFHSSTITVQDLQTFEQLTAAVLKRRRLNITYWTASRDAETERRIDPYHLANIDGDWYLIAYCHLREEVRMFAPSRIRKLAETGETFTPPEDFSIGRYLDGTFRVIRESGSDGHQVRLRFSPEVARWIREKVWHSTQKMTESPDGLLLEMHVSSLIEVRSWVLSFGANCEVLEPEELRESVQQEIGRMHSLYNGQAAPSKPLASSIRTRTKRQRQTG